jgi:glycerate-2-kinase
LGGTGFQPVLPDSHRLEAGATQKPTPLALSPDAFLRRHDAYSFFDAVGGLIRCGLTGTNVMDVRVVLVT